MMRLQSGNRSRRHEMKYIVVLESYDGIPQSYLSDGSGDPPRTTLVNSAKKFDTKGDAYIALGKTINKFSNRNFNTAKVQEVIT